MENHSPHKTVYKSATKTIDLTCSECGTHIPNKNINVNRSLGKCPSCDAIFSVDDMFFEDRRGRPEMIIPEGTELLTLPSSLDVELDWYKSTPKGIIGFLSLFSIFWNGFLLFFITSVGSIPFVLIFHLLAGAIMLYWLMSTFFNKTNIIVTSQYLEISHGPLKNPFKPTVTINVNNITQLYVEKYVSSTTNGQPNYAYALYCFLKNDKKAKLLDGMNKETQLYIEQEIERFLNIDDTAVANEILS
jgi:hypothetical protein